MAPLAMTKKECRVTISKFYALNQAFQRDSLILIIQDYVVRGIRLRGAIV